MCRVIFEHMQQILRHRLQNPVTHSKRGNVLFYILTALTFIAYHCIMIDLIKIKII